MACLQKDSRNAFKLWHSDFLSAVSFFYDGNTFDKKSTRKQICESCRKQESVFPTCQIIPTPGEALISRQTILEWSFGWPMKLKTGNHVTEGLVVWNIHCEFWNEKKGQIILHVDDALRVLGNDKLCKCKRWVIYSTHV